MLCYDCSEVLSSLSVALGTSKSTFSAAVDKTGRIYVEGSVRNSTPYLEKIGGFDVDLAMQGSVLLCRQRDQPGIVGNVGMALAKGNINISFMTVCRTSRNEEAIMAIGIDDEPDRQVSRPLTSLAGFTSLTQQNGERCLPTCLSAILALPRTKGQQIRPQGPLVRARFCIL